LFLPDSVSEGCINPQLPDIEDNIEDDVHRECPIVHSKHKPG
jgi:hypothetical protein